MKNIHIVLLLLSVDLIQASTGHSRLQQQDSGFDWDHVMQVMCERQVISPSGASDLTVFHDATHRSNVDTVGHHPLARGDLSAGLVVARSESAVGARHTPDAVCVSPACVVLRGVHSEHRQGNEFDDVPGYIPDEQFPVERVDLFVEDGAHHAELGDRLRLTEATFMHHGNASQFTGDDEDSDESSTGSNPLARRVRGGRDSFSRVRESNAGQTGQNLRGASPSIDSNEWMDRSFRAPQQHAAVPTHQVTVSDQGCCAKIIPFFTGCCK